MTTTTATLVHTASREAIARLAIARVAAGPRVTAARLSEERARQHAYTVAHETGQLCTPEQDWCYICGRPTDHTGEHTPEQVARWKAGRR